MMTVFSPFVRRHSPSRTRMRAPARENSIRSVRFVIISIVRTLRERGRVLLFHKETEALVFGITYCHESMGKQRTAVVSLISIVVRKG